MLSTGIESATLRSLARRSYQLCYAAAIMKSQYIDFSQLTLVNMLTKANKQKYALQKFFLRNRRCLLTYRQAIPVTTILQGRIKTPRDTFDVYFFTINPLNAL